MARRNDIDWEAVERLYRANKLTIRQIAEECGVSTSSITARSKSHKWERNLDEAIRERTDAKVAQIDVQALIEESAQQSLQKSAQTIQKAIEEASDIAAGVVRRHRSYIRRAEERVSVVEGILDSTLNQAGEIKDVVAVTSALKSLIESQKSLIALERQSYKLDSEQSESVGIADAIRKARSGE